MYVYEEVEDDYDEYESKKRGNRDSRRDEAESKAAAKKTTKRNYTKDKVSSDTNKEDETPSAGTDIRTAFLRSSMVSNNKSTTKSTATGVFSSDKIDQDELANEIMQELSRKNKNARPTKSVLPSQTARYVNL